MRIGKAAKLLLCTPTHLHYLCQQGRIPFEPSPEGRLLSMTTIRQMQDERVLKHEMAAWREEQIVKRLVRHYAPDGDVDADD